MSRALEGLDGVSSAVVQQDDDEKFDVIYDPQQVTLDAMLAAIRDAGSFQGRVVTD